MIRGRWVILASVLVVAVTFGGSAIHADATAPPQPEDTRLAVGIQGPGDAGAVEVYDGGQRTYRRADAASYHDVVWLSDTRLLASYIVDSDDCEQYPAPCGKTGFRVIDIRNDTVVREYTFEVRSTPNSEVHDAEPIGDGRVVVADMDRERVFIVDRDGEIAWQWNASAYYDAPADVTREDWLHINDVDHLGDGRFLVSVRNENQLLVVARGAGVVEVINREKDTDVLRQQHNPQWLDNQTVLVADSENGRVVELHQEGGAWQPRWSTNGADGQRFFWPRDADRHGTQTLVTDSRNHRVVLLDRDGSVVWEQPTSKLPYEADLRGGEAVGAPAIGAGGASTSGVSVPGLRIVVVLLQHTVGLPAWVTSWHLLVGVVASLGVLEGSLRELAGPDDAGHSVEGQEETNA